MMKAEEDIIDYWGLKTGPDGTADINGGLYKRPDDNKLFTFVCTLQIDDPDKAIKAVKKS